MLSTVWGASGSLWQLLWNYIYEDMFGSDEYALGIWGTALVTMGAFWIINAFLALIDFGQWEIFRQYKVQQDEKVSAHSSAIYIKILLFA